MEGEGLGEGEDDDEEDEEEEEDSAGLQDEFNWAKRDGPEEVSNERSFFLFLLLPPPRPAPAAATATVLNEPTGVGGMFFNWWLLSNFTPAGSMSGRGLRNSIRTRAAFRIDREGLPGGLR